jgi:hypothetical protein
LIVVWCCQRRVNHDIDVVIRQSSSQVNLESTNNQ